MSASTFTSHIVPAQLGFLAIYNPSLGTTDETLDDQIVYYSSAESQRRRRRRRRTNADDPPKSTQEEKNERLRKIGLAQGMVEFGRDFSDGKPVDTIETEKSRIVLHELEAGWWLLASIDLTRLPKPKAKPEDDDNIEYSSREVKPAALLLEDLLRAHSTFLLHHASSMSALFVRSRRTKFVNLLGRFWDSYLSTWNVMLHGNPAVNIYGGIKLAGSGELGVGVGEEDRGSGEREVLEGFVGRIEGLVDLVVSKFGGPEPNADEELNAKDGRLQARISPKQTWLGTGAEPTPEDGAVFLGVGALSRKSLRDITHWMEDLYTWGSRAYGVIDNPTSTRVARKKREKRRSASEKASSPAASPKEKPAHISVQLPGRTVQGTSSIEDRVTIPTDIPAPIASTSEATTSRARSKSKSKRPSVMRGRSSQSSVHSVTTTTGQKMVNYLKLGYGTHWSFGGNAAKSSPESEGSVTEQESPKERRALNRPTQAALTVQKNVSNNEGGSDSSPPPKVDTMGHYLIGLMGDIDSEEVLSGHGDDTAADEGTSQSGNFRMLLRTVTVELEREGDARAEADISIDLSTANSERAHSSKYGGSERTGTSNTSFESQDRNKTKKLRIVVYVNKPFIFVFLFELRTDALALMSLYRSIHQQLAPLQKPLLASTSERLQRPDITTVNSQEAKTPIYDLIWNSKTLTISSTIPNIPEPAGTPGLAARAAPWSRIEALNTHMHLLSTFAATHNSRSELESTSKTSRGWWIVWTRIPDPDVSPLRSKAPSPLPGRNTPQQRSEESGKSIRSGGSTSTRTGGVSQSMNSGPAHPFLDRDRQGELQDWVVPKDKEIILLRRASDYVGGKAISSLGTGSAGWGSGPAKLAQGIGVDTRRYIEGLLNMTS